MERSTEGKGFVAGITQILARFIPAIFKARQEGLPTEDFTFSPYVESSENEFEYSPNDDLHDYRRAIALSVFLDRLQRLAEKVSNLREDPSCDLTLILESLRQETQKVEQKLLHRITSFGKPTIAMVGEFSAGKSSLINALIDENICAEKIAPCTSVITYFKKGSDLKIFENRQNEISVEEYKSKSTFRSSAEETETRSNFQVEIPSAFLDLCTLIDAPGFGYDKAKDSAYALEVCKTADAIFAIFDINKGNPSRQIIETLKMTNNPHIVYIINKADTKHCRIERLKILKDFRNKIEKAYGVLDVNLIATSAKWIKEMPCNHFKEELNVHINKMQRALIDLRDFSTGFSGCRKGGDYVYIFDGRQKRIPIGKIDDSHVEFRAGLEKQMREIARKVTMGYREAIRSDVIRIKVQVHSLMEKLNNVFSQGFAGNDRAIRQNLKKGFDALRDIFLEMFEKGLNDLQDSDFPLTEKNGISLNLIGVLSWDPFTSELEQFKTHLQEQKLPELSLDPAEIRSKVVNLIGASSIEVWRDTGSAFIREVELFWKENLEKYFGEYCLNLSAILGERAGAAKQLKQEVCELTHDLGKLLKEYECTVGTSGKKTTID